MNWEEYQKLSIRTMAPLGEIYGASKVNAGFADPAIKHNFESIPKVLDSTHMALGMASEISELSVAIFNEDKVNISEELADICWYVSGEFHIIGLESNYDFNKSITIDLNLVDQNVYYNGLVKRISEYTDLIKRELAYRDVKSPEVKFSKLTYILGDIHELAVVHQINMEQALQNNIDKLRKRFPNKFNQDDALNRDLDSERKELEK